jgi:hypothetical protein
MLSLSVQLFLIHLSAYSLVILTPSGLGSPLFIHLRTVEVFTPKARLISAWLANLSFFRRTLLQTQSIPLFISTNLFFSGNPLFVQRSTQPNVTPNRLAKLALVSVPAGISISSRVPNTSSIDPLSFSYSCLHSGHSAAHSWIAEHSGHTRSRGAPSPPVRLVGRAAPSSVHSGSLSGGPCV